MRYAGAVTGNHSNLPKLPLRLSPLQVLGLRDPEEGDWGRLRALQYAQLHEASLTRVMAHALAALLTVSLFLGKAPLWLLGAWLAVLALAVGNATRIDRGLAAGDRPSMSRAEYKRQAHGVAACALAWAFALVAFVPFASQAELFALWTLVAMLIGCSAATMSAAPLATVVFAGITGATAVATFGLGGDYGFAAVTAAFLLIAISGTIEAGRVCLSARIAEAGVAEKDEVVSLLLREFQENDADWLWQIDTNRRVRAASPRFAYALGRDPGALDGAPLIQLIAGDAWASGQFPPSLHDLAGRLKRRENFSNLLVQVQVDSGRRWWELSGTPMLDDQGNFLGFRGVGSDVTEQRESDEKIAYLARYDTLTGLPNRLMLTEALGEAMRYAEQWKSQCAFLMIDLDRFKAVNDSLGHQVGDRLLAQVSQRLMAAAGENEQCGRLGGDEFAIVIRDASDKGRVSRIAEAVIEALSQPYDVDHHKLYIGASVGSALCPKDGNTVEALMRNADLALYRAKDDGGGAHYSYEPSLHANAEERRQLEHSLRHAIGKKEFRLNFQPVVDAHSEELVSFEAAQWEGELKVAVNVSGEQLLEPGFASHVIRALGDSGLPAHRLEVEVTESNFLRDARTARQALEEIMAMGCSVALDDFGTGYSSLGYIRALKFSTIKVDRSFVRKRKGNQASAKLLAALSNSARPSVLPCSGSIARSGCGIMPRTLPASLSTPAISRREPLQVCA